MSSCSISLVAYEGLLQSVKVCLSRSLGPSELRLRLVALASFACRSLLLPSAFGPCPGLPETGIARCVPVAAAAAAAWTIWQP